MRFEVIKQLNTPADDEVIRLPVEPNHVLDDKTTKSLADGAQSKFVSERPSKRMPKFKHQPRED